jgi:hypothetical protein
MKEIPLVMMMITKTQQQQQCDGQVAKVNRIEIPLSTVEKEEQDWHSFKLCQMENAGSRSQQYLPE